MRFQKNGEAEVSCALALLQDLVGQLGRRFLDVFVGDVLYLPAPFVKEVERLGLAWAFTLKENQPEALREAERCTQDSPTGMQAERDREIQYWHLPEVDWLVANRQVRVVKTVCTEPQRRVTVRAFRTKAETAILQPGTNFKPPVSNSAASRPSSSISPVAAIGESTPKSFRPSPPTAISTPRGAPNHRPRGSDHDPVSCLYPLPGPRSPPNPETCSPKISNTY